MIRKLMILLLLAMLLALPVMGPGFADHTAQAANGAVD